MAYPTERELYRLVLDNLFGLTTQEKLAQARRCSLQRASQIVGQVVYKATGGHGLRRPPAPYIAFLLARRDMWRHCRENTPEDFYWHERKLSRHEDW